ncbi:MAG: HEAT repeat domain-containing protein [Anaerolineae bacterium]|nr:HEAT repeat domain-containing protein [Anaerolineae bacterium]
MTVSTSPSNTNDDVQRALVNLQSLNPRLRSQAAEDLGRMQNPDGINTLIEMLDTDVNTYVRSACAEALGHIGLPQAIFPLMDAIRDNCSFVRRAAIIALGQMQAKQAQGALIQALEDPNFYVRRAAINAIGKLDLPELGNTLLPFLDTHDPRIQRTTIIALRRLAATETIPVMIDMLQTFVRDPNQRDLPVVKTLVIALGELNATEAAPVLIDVLRGYVGVRSLAATALAQIGAHQAIPALLQALEDKSVNLQLASLKSLGQLGSPRILPDIIKFLDAPDPRLRRSVIYTIGMLKDKASASILLEIAQNDASPLVRPAAVEAIGMLGNPDMITPLLAMATDSNAYLRAALAHTLSSLDGESENVQKVLRALSQDQVEHVAIAAQRALARCEARSHHPSPDPAACPEPTQKHKSWLSRFLGRN